ncbi:MAG: excinuclease ABC subunit UvrA [Candidatus Omnitrophica bacterium]|nr:excinuclease ABC subunit UvrA [Candidatus Omnitrophota bacterium]MDD5671791.1 excinuclease ABC subunit UvrA [Candidatus Omnitrophota bacterium]
MDAIVLRGIKTHNLKNLDLEFPHRKFYVVTGVSGSGKSSLAFDTLYAEGQRRYVESLSAYARQFLERMEKPDVESVSGIPPAIAIEAKNVISNARSTVGTQTEINDYLRLLYARIGHTLCTECGVEVRRNQPGEIAALLMKDHMEEDACLFFNVPLAKKGKRYLEEFLPELERQGFLECLVDGKILLLGDLTRIKKPGDAITVLADRLKIEGKNRKRLADSLELAFRFGRGEVQIKIGRKRYQFSEGFRCFSCGKNYREPTPNLFSFNSPLGACPDCQGFGRIITIDWNLVVPDTRKSVFDGAIAPWSKPGASWEFQQLLKFCRAKKIPASQPWRKLSKQHQRWILEGVPGYDYFSVKEFFEYLERKTYKMHVRVFLSKYRGYLTCRTCGETRLKTEALAVKVQDKNIYEVQMMSIQFLQEFLENLKLTAPELERVEPVYLELKKRVRFLKEVGLGYLSLARLSRTLSGGEVQRIHLATSLGSALVDTLYVLDEPSVGLHERDNHLLIKLLKDLRDLGNTVMVVEHDRTMIEAADEVVDLGPGGGQKGGQVLFKGTVEALQRAPGSLTGEYLSGKREVVRRQASAAQPSKWIRVRNAAEHNLKKIDVDIPLQQLVVMTGVSGAGKSTLLYDILYHHYLRFKGRPVQDIGKAQTVSGYELIDEMVMVDQTPIGRSPRSNPATYLKAFDEIRRIFAATADAKRMGFEAGAFSFNVDGGRCDTCKGDGRIKVEMHFLADVFVTCEACQGKRFKEEILDIRYGDKNIDDVLQMTVEEALLFFRGEKKLEEKLSLLTRIGLGYLRLGQSATTLSGGEAQRLKLAVEMSEKKGQSILYLFDEPTTGLHYHDIHCLIEAFEELLARGHSIVVIEHNMEIIRSADYLIDLGPEGGAEGGDLIYAGPARGILGVPNSYTGRFLKQHVMRFEANTAKASG